MKELYIQFKDIESLFSKLVHEYVYGNKVFCVLEDINIAIEDKFITYKFRYGIEDEAQNNPKFFMDLKYYNNLDYLRGRFEQYLEAHHLETNIWEREKKNGKIY